MMTQAIHDALAGDTSLRNHLAPDGDARRLADALPFTVAQLEHVYRQTFEAVHGDLLIDRNILPIDTSVPADASTFEWFLYDVVGFAKLAAIGANDVPMIDIVGARQIGKLEAGYAGWRHDYLELARAARGGLALDAVKAKGARRAHAELWNRIMCFGSAPWNFRGFFTHPNVTQLSSAGGAWSTRTIEQVLADIETMVAAIEDLSRRPCTNILLPKRVMRGLSSRMVGGGNGTESFLGVIEKHFRGITLDDCYELVNTYPGNPFTSDCAFAFNKNADFGAMVIAEPYRALPPVPDLKGVEIATESIGGGVAMRFPLAFALMEDV